MIESPLRLVPHALRIASTLVYRYATVDRGFVEIWRVESLEEKDHRRVVVQIRNETSTGAAVYAKESGLERVKQWERLVRTHPIKVAAETQGVTSDGLSDDGGGLPAG